MGGGENVSVTPGPLTSSGGGALAIKWNDPIFRSKLLNYTYSWQKFSFLACHIIIIN